MDRTKPESLPLFPNGWMDGWCPRCHEKNVQLEVFFLKKDDGVVIRRFKPKCQYQYIFYKKNRDERKWHTTQYEIGTIQVSGNKNIQSSTRTTYSMSHVRDFQASYRTWSQRSSSSLILLGRYTWLSKMKSLGIQSPCQMMIGLYNHLRNARYFGSTKPFSVIGSLGNVYVHLDNAIASSLRSRNQIPPHRVRRAEKWVRFIEVNTPSIDT